jgi:HK97 family phage major capsid protein
MMKQFIEQQMAQRATAWEAAKKILDVATAEKRDLTAEETQTYDKISKELEDRQATIEKMRADEARELRLDAATREMADQVRPVADAPRAARTDAEVIRSMAKGEIRSHSFEKRDLVKTQTGAPVPTSFYDQVIMLARHVGPMLQTSTVLNTAGGENLQIPSLAQYSTAAITSEGTAISESDPVFNSFVTLSAYKFSFLVQLSTELIEDSGVDILSFLADQVGNELGFRVNASLTTGTGSSQPNGIVTASSLGVTGATAVTGAFTADNLISLVYSVDTAGRRLAGSGFQMNASSIAKMRSLKDTAGNFVFSPALNADAQDLLLGYPVFENPGMASTGTANKSVIFGHLPSYFVRQVGGIKLDRSDDFAFNAGLVTFRATMRVDGNLPQTSHVKHFIGGAS